MPRKYTKKKGRKKIKRGGTPPKTLSDGENIMNDEIIILKNRLDELEMKLEICCSDMVQGANTIQRMTRGHQGRNTFKQTRRTMKPNVTDALLDLPQDVGDLIASHRNDKSKTKGWTIFPNSIPEQTNEWSIGPLEEKKASVIQQNKGGLIRWFSGLGAQSDRGAAIIKIKNSNPDELISSLTIHDESKYNESHGGWHPYVWIAPGASLKLLKQKEIEGFEVEYDPIDK
jgi:hypothetical protein